MPGIAHSARAQRSGAWAHVLPGNEPLPLPTAPPPFLPCQNEERSHGYWVWAWEDASDRCTRDPMQRPPPPSARRWPTIGYRGFRLGDWGMGIGVPTMDIFISTIWMGSNAFRLELSIEYVCILVTVAVFKIFSFYVMCTNCSCWIFREYL